MPINLERITPAFLHFPILTPSHHDEGERTLIDYELCLYKVRFNWQTRIEFTPISSFIDAQVSGPYRRWHHRHEFEEAPGGTLMRDEVEYEVPLGPLGALISSSLFVASSTRSSTTEMRRFENLQRII